VSILPTFLLVVLSPKLILLGALGAMFAAATGGGGGDLFFVGLGALYMIWFSWSGLKWLRTQELDGAAGFALSIGAAIPPLAMVLLRRL
jgi:hypothetical protein